MPKLDVNGTTLNVVTDGEARRGTVMLSNSLASNLTMWDSQVGPLTAAGFRVVRYDSRGHGQSEVPAGPYSIELLADDAVALMDALNLDAVHFCGLSKGGMVAQMLGHRHAGRVQSLAICASAAHMAPRETWEQRAALVAEKGMESVVDGTLERWFTAHGRASLKVDVARVRAMILATPPAGFVACCQAIMNMDQREMNRTIRAPTTVIVGDQDPGTTPAHAQEIADAIDGASLVVIPGAAHFVNVEQPGPFNDALLSHLNADV